MATFITPSSTSEELAGSMTDFVGKNIAMRPLGRPISVKTEFGMAPALRVQVIDLEAKTDAGVRLLFWASVRDAVAAVANAGIDWAVGTITHTPQKNDPSRSVYLLEALTIPNDQQDALGAFLDTIPPKVA